MSLAFCLFMDEARPSPGARARARVQSPEPRDPSRAAASLDSAFVRIRKSALSSLLTQPGCWVWQEEYGLDGCHPQLPCLN